MRKIICNFNNIILRIILFVQTEKILLKLLEIKLINHCIEKYAKKGTCWAIISLDPSKLRSFSRLAQRCVSISYIMFDNRIMLKLTVNNCKDSPSCNVARANKSKPEITRCDFASIFRWFRLLLGSSPLLFRSLLRMVATMAHVHTHEPHARTYIRSAIRKEHCEASCWFLSQKIPLVTSMTFNLTIMLGKILFRLKLVSIIV